MRSTMRGMRWASNWMVAMGVALFLAAPLARAQTADASFELSAGMEQTGIGYSWARGTLYYGGRSYPFRLNGLSVVDMDVPLEADGAVYHLAHLSDLDGTYAEVEVAPALAGAGFTAAIENEHGVLIGLRSTTQGLYFEPSLLGVEIQLLPAP
jgi:hypothetical protein